MRKTVSAVAFAGFLGCASAALAQPGDQVFHEQTLRALERIERALERIERRLDAPAAPAAARDDEVVAASSEVCGTLMANCEREAMRHCARLNYARGVPLRIEARGQFNYMVRVRCFN